MKDKAVKILTELIDLDKKTPNDFDFGGKVRQVIKNLEVKK